MFKATTILAVQKNGHVAIAGDGQVTMGNSVVMKNTAKKSTSFVSRKNSGWICGFCGRCLCTL